MSGRLWINLVLLMGGTTGAGWAVAWATTPGLSVAQHLYAAGGVGFGAAAALWAIADIARAEV